MEEASVVVVVAGLTVWLSAGEVLFAKLESPGYCAVILSAPPFRVEIVNVAVPEANGAVPSTVCLNKNMTVSPSGGAPTLEVTTAVKVTGWP
jgi:hypothetical protein